VTCWQANIAEYIALLVAKRLVDNSTSQMGQVLEGFTSVAAPGLLDGGHLPLTVAQLQELVAGCPRVDVEDFKQHTDVRGVVAEGVVALFWLCVAHPHAALAGVGVGVELPSTVCALGDCV